MSSVWETFPSLDEPIIHTIINCLIRCHLLFHLPNNVLHVERRHLKAVCVKPSSINGCLAAGTIRLSERLTASCKQSERRRSAISRGEIESERSSGGTRLLFSTFYLLLCRSVTGWVSSSQTHLWLGLKMKNIFHSLSVSSFNLQYILPGQNDSVPRCGC